MKAIIEHRGHRPSGHVYLRADLTEDFKVGITLVKLLNLLWILQKDAGYHPEGYGTPSGVAITGSEVTWTCSDSCD